MNDKEFLTWLYFRLLNVYHESPNCTFCYKLAAIIDVIPSDQITLVTFEKLALIDKMFAKKA